MKFIYDGLSLPMVEVGNQVIRVQRLVGGRWSTVESEGFYELLFPELSVSKSVLTGTPDRSESSGFANSEQKETKGL